MGRNISGLPSRTVWDQALRIIHPQITQIRSERWYETGKSATLGLQPKHLTNVGELHEIIEGGATADAPMFQTSVTFFQRVDRRGKNPRVRAPEGLLPRWVDCLWQ